MHDFLGMGTPSYINSSNLLSPSFYDHDVSMSFRTVLEKIGNERIMYSFTAILVSILKNSITSVASEFESLK